MSFQVHKLTESGAAFRSLSEKRWTLLRPLAAPWRMAGLLTVFAAFEGDMPRERVRAGTKLARIIEGRSAVRRTLALKNNKNAAACAASRALTFY